MNKLVLALALFAAPLTAFADEARLPFNPFEKAEKGDWCVATGTFKREGAGEQKTACASYARITKVDGDEVVLSEQVQVGAVETATRKFSKKEAPTVVAYFDLKEGEVSSVKVEDDKRKVCDKELACKKLTFVWKHDHSEDEVTAWLSTEVKAGGLVAFNLKGTLKGKVELATSIKMECGGCGTANDKTMGDSPDELLDAELLGEPDEALALPFDPFAKGKVGDWTALRVDNEAEGRTESGVLHFEVARLKKDAIELEATMKRVGRGGRDDSSTIKIERDKPLNVLEYVSLLVKGRRHQGDKVAVKGLKVVDDKRTVADHEFACKKVTFSFKEHSDLNVKVKLWLSPDVKGMGFVAAEIRAKRRDENLKMDLEVVGFGGDDKTEWGRTAEQAARKKKNAEKAVELFWKDAPVGSVYETKTVTDMTKPVAMKTEMTMKQTLKAKDDDGYTLTTVMTAGGTEMPGNDTTIEWPKAGGAEARDDVKSEKLDDEDVKVDGKAYTCQHWKTETEAAGVKSVVESWMYKGIVLKMKMKNDNMTMTMKCTKLEKKGDE